MKLGYDTEGVNRNEGGFIQHHGNRQIRVASRMATQTKHVWFILSRRFYYCRPLLLIRFVFVFVAANMTDTDRLYSVQIFSTKHN